MDSPNFCSECGVKIETANSYCPKCGANLTLQKNVISQKSGTTTFILAILFGTFGVHRFFTGKIGTGILMLLTLGGFGIWTLIDIAFIATNKFTDKQEKTIVFLQRPNTIKKLFAAILGMIASYFIFIIVFISLIFYLTGGIVDTVRFQLDALRNNDLTKAYFYNSKDFQKATSLEEYRYFIDAHPSLKENKSLSIQTREIKNNLGFIKGTLTAKDGAKTPIAYQLIKEDGVWKILNIRLLPGGIQSDQQNKPPVLQHAALFKEYQDTNNRYSIKYPEDWIYVKRERGTVIFSGKMGVPSYYTTVNIQTVLTKNAGGVYHNINEFIQDLKNQINKYSNNPKIISEGPISLPQDSKIQGKYILFQYSRGNESFRQLQIVFLRPDDPVFYTYAYTAPENLYQSELETAKKMFKTFYIK